MKIPFGTEKPDDKESALLTQLGFDLSKMTYSDNEYYQLEVPNKPEIKVKNDWTHDGQVSIYVSFNETYVLTVKYSTRNKTPFTFQLHEENILQAIATNNKKVESHTVVNTTERLTMHIPLGKKEPNEKEQQLFEKIGFDLKRDLSLQGNDYYLEIPENSGIECTREMTCSNRCEIKVSVNKLSVIHIEVASSSSARLSSTCVDLKFNEENISKINPAVTKPKADIRMTAKL